VVQTANNGSVRLAFEVEGDGPPLLLVHGLGYCREGWGPALPLLCERFRVISFDNRGLREGRSRYACSLRTRSRSWMRPEKSAPTFSG
jgi:pimeloyl-ACP methyl ester carboxylesterase